jgi:hypothetical protein
MAPTSRTTPARLQGVFDAELRADNGPSRGHDASANNVPVRRRRRGTLTPAAEHVNDQTHWTVTTDGTTIDVGSRAGAWHAATSAYSPGHPVIVSAA